MIKDIEEKLTNAAAAADEVETIDDPGSGAEVGAAAAVGGEVWTPRTTELLEPEAGGFYSGGGTSAVADQDRTPFPVRGGGGISAGSGRASEPEPAAAIVRPVDPFLAAIEAASTPDRPALTQQQQQAQRGTPSPANQDSTPFPAMGRPRQDIGDGVPGAPPVATPSDHALGMEALARNAQGTAWTPPRLSIACPRFLLRGC